MVEHAKLRALERFGLDLTPDMMERFIREIVAGQNAVKLRSQPGGRAIWGVRLNGTIHVVVYQKGVRSLVTFLPPDGSNIIALTQQAQNAFYVMEADRRRKAQRKLGRHLGVR